VNEKIWKKKEQKIDAKEQILSPSTKPVDKPFQDYQQRAWKNRRYNCNYNRSQLHHLYEQTVCRYLREASCEDKDRHQPFGRISIRGLLQDSLL
jgi:hypothetical protein